MPLIIIFGSFLIFVAGLSALTVASRRRNVAAALLLGLLGVIALLAGGGMLVSCAVPWSARIMF